MPLMSKKLATTSNRYQAPRPHPVADPAPSDPAVLALIRRPAVLCSSRTQPSAANNDEPQVGKYFALTERRSKFSTELRAGTVTFLTARPFLCMCMACHLSTRSTFELDAGGNLAEHPAAAHDVHLRGMRF